MISDDKQTPSPRFALQVRGLTILNKKKAELETLAQEMACKADSFGYLDPLDQEPSLIFDPRF